EALRGDAAPADGMLIFEKPRGW
ncbi:MAG: hypothetical protein JWN79_3142, partial [Gemmatimonadetes bacterium]|nr:hypothetical protein [Gemmatimonadota bacterium]